MMLRGVLVALLLGSASAQLSFVEEVGAVEHTYSGGADYIVGGGLATFDCDDNELPDLFIAGGEEPAALFRNVSEVGAELSFQNVELEEFEFVTGAYPLKLDADEHTDLIVLRLGENLILRGLGECRFERANEAFGFDGDNAWTTRLVPLGSKMTRCPRSLLEITLTVACQEHHLELVLITRFCGQWGRATIPPKPSRATVHCLCCLVIGTARVSPICASAMTGSITSPIKSVTAVSSYLSSRTPSPPTPRPMVGKSCKFGVWASPAPTSRKTAILNCT